MRGLPGLIGKLGLMGVAMLGAAGIAFWATDFGATSATSPDSSTADAFADRFAASLSEIEAQPAPAWLAAADDTGQRLSLFSPRPTYPVTAASFAPTQTLPETTGSTSASARNANRKPTVFNDAQIASIKKRLNLTKAQEEYWPAVEAMLRRLAWKKTPESTHGKTTPMAERRLAALDVNSGDLAQLQSTAGPLLMSFNEDQKRELRMLAHLAGLQDVFSKF
jgi:hypothetical protein